MRRALGVNTWVWASPLSDATLETLAGKIARLGFTAIELPVEQPGDWSPERARGIVAEHGLAPVVVGAMGAGRNLVAAPRDQIAATQAYLMHCVDVAHALGSSSVAGPFYTETGRTWRISDSARQGLYDELRDALAPVVAHAEAAGVRLAVEPLNRYETSLINTVDQGLGALGPLLGGGLGLALDSYHMNIEERGIAAAIRSAGTHIAHVQVCGNDRGAAGGDNTDWPAFLDALDDAGYAGPLVLESFTGDNDTIAVAASVWRPLASSQDALAEDTLGFLTAMQTERYPR